MAVVDGGTVVGQVLQEQKVRYLFAINGGHTFPILANLSNHGIKLIHMRHEQATAYAADGWARSTKLPGVCCVTAGCGLTNAVTGLCVAGLTNSAVVCLSGQHPTLEDGIGSFQEAYGSEICRTFSKYTKRVLDWQRIAVDLRQAFREATCPPQGVALVEFPTNVLYHQAEEKTQFPGAKVYDPDELRSQADPRSIDRAVELLAGAERPLLVGGDGVFWSGAAEELRELAERTHAPVYSRRAGQGAVPEDHALAVRGAWKKPFTGRADVIVAVGFRYWSGEKFGQPPTWNGQAKYVQVDPTATRVGWHVPAEVALVGDPKLVLRQVIEGVKQRQAEFEGKRSSSWLKEVAEARANFSRMIQEREEKVRGSVPIHPDRLARDLISVLDPSATMIVDSFTLSGYLSHWFTARFPGQIVDAGPLAPVGHGIGMAIGVQLARPSKPVVTVIGDGGIGIGGWDMETAAKYKLPVVAVLWNNSSWGPSFDQMPMLKGRTEPFDMLPNIRYDRIFTELGCHGEHVEKPDELLPALERAFKSGKPALVNVIGDKRIGHPSLGGNLLGSTQV
ncbi:MAG TPA: thiamine pyrophosphate-binding protein [Gemmataceae bacterium]|nr:thiamine pyrophosphate-binding protein [Gemmataceae bacterium]